MDRRQFLDHSTRTTLAMGTAAIGTAAMVASSGAAQAAPNDRVTVCVAGVRGRGNALLRAFAANSAVDVKYVCDIDEAVLKGRTAQVASLTGKKPEAITDFRKALDDKDVAALVLGTPDHWHALPTILACQAGKDVYVEKPDGHNIREGQTMVAAAKKYERIIQLGTQARSGKHHAAAIEYLRSGAIGRALYAKAWESAKQGGIGRPKDGTPPATVDYDTWLGPAPKRAFNVNRFHGNWRWFFDYGTGDLGNDGVHRLDNARRGLEAALAAEKKTLAAVPRTVSATGGKYYFDDAQEWPDTLVVSYDYPGYVLTYEMRIWSPYPYYGESEGAAVFGDAGYVVIGNSRWRAYDARARMIKEASGGDHTSDHVQNFIDCMRSRDKPTADLETVGHPSSLMCHLGNVAWRVGRSVRYDPQTYAFPGDSEANALLTRPEYRKPWVLPEISQL